MWYSWMGQITLLLGWKTKNSCVKRRVKLLRSYCYQCFFRCFSLCQHRPSQIHVKHYGQYVLFSAALCLSAIKTMFTVCPAEMHWTTLVNNWLSLNTVLLCFWPRLPLRNMAIPGDMVLFTHHHSLGILVARQLQLPVQWKWCNSRTRQT